MGGVISKPKAPTPPPSPAPVAVTPAPTTAEVEQAGATDMDNKGIKRRRTW
jgi:hypothetical protein